MCQCCLTNYDFGCDIKESMSTKWLITFSFLVTCDLSAMLIGNVVIEIEHVLMLLFGIMSYWMVLVLTIVLSYFYDCPVVICYWGSIFRICKIMKMLFLLLCYIFTFTCQSLMDFFKDLQISLIIVCNGYAHG